MAAGGTRLWVPLSWCDAADEENHISRQLGRAHELVINKKGGAMRHYWRIILAGFLVCSFVVISFPQERSPAEVRQGVEQLCQSGELTSAFDVAVKSLRHAWAHYGSQHAITAECMTIVADVAKRQNKPYLAAFLYQRALSIQERTLGPTHPEVNRSKMALHDLNEYQAP
jgi:hypothetical protein